MKNRREKGRSSVKNVEEEVGREREKKCKEEMEERDRRCGGERRRK